MRCHCIMAIIGKIQDFIERAESSLLSFAPVNPVGNKGIRGDAVQQREMTLTTIAIDLDNSSLFFLISS